MKNVKVFRLNTGHDIVGELEEETDTHFRIKNPCIAYIKEGGNSQGNNQLAIHKMVPLSANPSVDMKKDLFAFDYLPIKELEDLYQRFYLKESGLILASDTIPNNLHDLNPRLLKG